MKSVLKMVLSLPGNRSMTYSLAEPKEGLTKAEVQATLQGMLGKQAIVVDGNFPTAIKDAYIQESNRRELA